jgi:hypothetical protein
MPTNPTDNGSPRPPEGDWLGTPFLTFRRDGPFAVVTLDRPEARNAMTPRRRTAVTMSSVTAADVRFAPHGGSARR